MEPAFLNTVCFRSDEARKALTWQASFETGFQKAPGTREQTYYIFLTSLITPAIFFGGFRGSEVHGLWVGGYFIPFCRPLFCLSASTSFSNFSRRALYSGELDSSGSRISTITSLCTCGISTFISSHLAFHSSDS